MEWKSDDQKSTNHAYKQEVENTLKLYTIPDGLMLQLDDFSLPLSEHVVVLTLLGLMLHHPNWTAFTASEYLMSPLRPGRSQDEVSE